MDEEKQEGTPFYSSSAFIKRGVILNVNWTQEDMLGWCIWYPHLNTCWNGFLGPLEASASHQQVNLPLFLAANIGSELEETANIQKVMFMKNCEHSWLVDTS